MGGITLALMQQEDGATRHFVIFIRRMWLPNGTCRPCGSFT
jgi:hypothetical protein